MDENLIETNSFFILHCFRNPLIFFEPKMKVCGSFRASRSMEAGTFPLKGPFFKKNGAHRAV